MKKQTTLLLRIAYISVLLKNHSSLSCFSNSEVEFFKSRFSKWPIELPKKESVAGRTNTWFRHNFSISLQEYLADKDISMQTILLEIRHALRIPEAENDLVLRWLLEETLTIHKKAEEDLQLSLVVGA